MASGDGQADHGNEDERRFAAALAGFHADESSARTALGDPSPGVRAAAFGALVRMERATADDVAAAVADPDPGVRRRTCELAGRLGTLPLAGLLGDPDPTVVEAAAFAAGEIGDLDSVVALCEIAAGHPDPLCRESAVAALGAIGDERARAVLLGALEDVAPIRRRAVIALAGFEGDDVERALRGRLEDRDWQVRQAAEDLVDLNRGQGRSGPADGP